MKLRSRSSRRPARRCACRAAGSRVEKHGGVVVERIQEPSARRNSFVCRTTTARNDLAFLTPAFGMRLHRGDEDVADLGRRAGGRADTRRADSSRAPLLSATRTRVYGDHLASSSSSSRSGFAETARTRLRMPRAGGDVRDLRRRARRPAGGPTGPRPRASAWSRCTAALLDAHEVALAHLARLSWRRSPCQADDLL